MPPVINMNCDAVKNLVYRVGCRASAWNYNNGTDPLTIYSENITALMLHGF